MTKNGMIDLLYTSQRKLTVQIGTVLHLLCGKKLTTFTGKNGKTSSLVS